MPDSASELQKVPHEFTPTVSRPSAKLGDVIAARYSLVSLVSTTDAASVYRAADLSNNGAPVALKVLDGQHSAEVLEEFFQREVESLRRLRHPNIVRLLDAGTGANGCRWLALEWLERGTLQEEAWRKVHRDGTRTLVLLRDILGALASAHRAGIIHRDVKPGNILFDAAGIPKIADFNVSKLLGRTRSTRTLKAYLTPRWAAPEQLAGRPADERSDIYSLGRIAAELVTGYEGDDSGGLSAALDKSSAPGPMRRLLRSMMQPELSSRPTGGEALRDVQAIIESVGPESRIVVKLTKKVAEDIATLQGNATPKDVLDLVAMDLAGRLHVDFTARTSDHGGTIYTLLGKRFSYLAAADQDLGMHADELTLIGILRVPVHQREHHRSACAVVPFVADIKQSSFHAPPGDSLRGFVNAFEEARTRRDARRQDDYLTGVRLEAWQSYIDLSRALKTDRSNIGILRQIKENQEEALIECEVQPMLVSPDELIDAWLRYVVPGGQMIPLGVVVECSDSRITLRPNEDLENASSLPWGGTLIRDSRQEEASLQRQTEALRMLRDREDAEGDLLDLLAKPDRAAAAHRVHIEPKTKGLHTANREVVELALGVERLFMVQGPPGTGKTTVIAELISQILTREPESRVLLVSQSNVAIDNVLERLEKLLPEVPAVRLGRAEKIGASTRRFMLHARITGELQRFRSRAAEARDRLARLAQRGPEELGWLAEELTKDDGTTADQSDARKMLAEALGADPASGDSVLARGARAAQWLLGGAVDLADIRQLQENWVARVQTSEDLEELILRSTRVVAGTCVGVVQNRVISKSDFAWVIVDEAGRASPTEVLVPLVRGRRLVLLGDHRQLPPVLEEEVTRKVAEQLAISEEALRRSLFQDLFENVSDGVRARLTAQYRMHPEIGGLIEHVFYPEGLEHAVTAAERPLGVTAWGHALRWLDTAKVPHAGERRVGSSYRNQAEVSVIQNALAETHRQLAQKGLRASVGVLTGYAAQLESIQQMVAQKRNQWPSLDVHVLTVDAAQGKEYELVFYSAVRSNPEGKIGFLRDERRLNVALSRAQHGLTIVGDLQSLLSAGTRFGSNPFVGIHAWFSKQPKDRPVVEAPRP